MTVAPTERLVARGRWTDVYDSLFDAEATRIRRLMKPGGG
jgi:hypothetical protein